MSTFADYKAMKLPQPRLFGLEEIESAVQVSTCPVQSMGQPPFHPFLAGGDSQTCVKSGYVEGDEYYVIKVAPGGVRENEARGLPVNTGLNLLFSQRTTRLEAIFFDEGLLTELRTAAAAALAARVLAPVGDDLSLIGMLGAGVQARWQLRLLKAVTPCRRALVHARSADRVQKFCEDMRQEGWDIRVATPEEIFGSCQLIHTTTTARAPILKAEWLSASRDRGLHINAMGSDVPGKQELDPQLVKSASLLVCDSRAQTFERGEFQQAATDGLIHRESVLELGELLERPELHRKVGDPRFTVFDSSGVAVQDVMITKMVYEALTRKSAL